MSELEPKFKPGDICKDRYGVPGLVTHHVVRERRGVYNEDKGCYDCETIILYKGMCLGVDTLGQSWLSQFPTLLHSLGDAFNRGE